MHKMCKEKKNNNKIEKKTNRIIEGSSVKDGRHPNILNQHNNS